MNCLFCRIIAGAAPATIIYQDQDVIVFDDIYPKAPQHKLIVPLKHIATLNDLASTDINLISKMTVVAQKLAKDLNIADSGYRVAINCNKDGGQMIYHLHMHLMGGRPM